MRLTFLGHSCFFLETPKARLLFDPFLTGNPCAARRADEIECDYLLCSHGHDDHIGDALRIGRRCGATVVGNFELTKFLGAQGAKTHGLNPGGGADFPFGRVTLTLAHHSSSHIEQGRITYLGSPCGILVETEDRILYHAGDTALFLDMQLIARAGIDLAMIPIGDNFTMGPRDALLALDFLKPRLAVPMHYDTWPVIHQDAAKFADDAAAKGHIVRPLKPGESLEV